MDSVGCGVQKDYKKFHPHTCNTLLNVYKHNRNFKLPLLERMGLKKILFDKEAPRPYCCGNMNARTAGNDTMAGLWEMLGVVFKKRFRSDTCGLPQRKLKEIEKRLGVPLVGNEYISGVQAINKYYNLHVQKRGPIIYFDKDGVALLAAHEKIIPATRLHAIGKELAKELLPFGIIRIITRPFVGKLGNFQRKRGKYFVLVGKKFFNRSVLNYIKQKKIKIITTAHIKSLLGDDNYIQSIEDHIENLPLLKKINKTIINNTKQSVMIFCLREFDMLGHYNNVIGYGQKLQEIDKYLSNIIKNLTTSDLLILTADHGCDPTVFTRGHSRERVPLIAFSKSNKQKIWLGQRKTFADLGQTINYNFRLKTIANGTIIKELFD